jgi:hypothetical protein
MRLVLDLLDAPEDVPGAWSPFRETRPLADLVFGTRTLGARIERALDGAAPAGGDPDPTRGHPVVLDPRFVPEGPLGLETLLGSSPPDGGQLRLSANGRTVGWVLAVGAAPGDLPPAADVAGIPSLELPGTFLSSPWELMARNADRVTRDLLDDPPANAVRLASPPAGVQVLGAYPVTVASDRPASIDPFVVLDARRGPIHLASGVEIRAHTRLEGPAWIGAGTRLLGGVFSELSTGPVCRLRGEVEASVVNGWCNKAHDGYLGHAVLGRWVNLGALTTNSDLKNTYGPVRVHVDTEHTVDTGRIKVGVLLGDHVKTGIGTLLNTGTVVGAGTNLFAGGPLPPRWVPPFSWGSGDRLDVYRLDAFLDVAERAMARRDQALDAHEREALIALWRATHGTAPAPGDEASAPPPADAQGTGTP